MLEKEKVSAIIPCYNMKDYVVQAIESARSQTISGLEILLVDDGSTDGTEKILDRYRNMKNIRVINKANGGLSAARNTGILESSSQYVAFLDADDEWEPRKLERQLQRFHDTEWKNLGLVYTNSRNVDARGISTAFPSPPLDPAVRGDVASTLIRCNLIIGSGSAVLAKKECFSKVGLFNEKLPSCEDWEMWYRISKYYQIDFVNEELVAIRRHPQSMQKNKEKMCRGTLQVLSGFTRQEDFNRSVFAYWVEHYIASIVSSLIEGACSIKALQNASAILWAKSILNLDLCLRLLPRPVISALKSAVWRRYKGLGKTLARTIKGAGRVA